MKTPQQFGESTGRGTEEEYTSLYHRMKPGKHDFWKRTPSENNFWPTEKREPLSFSRAKGVIREYTGAGAIKDQRLPCDVR